VLFQGGTADFTLSDVAAAAGIARATLIQRFENIETILRRVAERQLTATADYLAGLPLEKGATGLWHFWRRLSAAWAMVRTLEFMSNSPGWKEMTRSCRASIIEQMSPLSRKRGARCGAAFVLLSY